MVFLVIFTNVRGFFEKSFSFLQAKFFATYDIHKNYSGFL